MSAPNNPRAFPSAAIDDAFGGMTLRDHFAGLALPLVSETYPEWQLKEWFGNRTKLTRQEIRAKAAFVVADAMLAERAK